MQHHTSLSKNVVRPKTSMDDEVNANVKEIMNLTYFDPNQNSEFIHAI